MEDDEKALFKDNLSFEDTYKFGLQNAKDIIACGFDLKKTFIYSDLDYIKGHMLMNVWEFSKLITFNQVRGAFGFNERYYLSLVLGFWKRWPLRTGALAHWDLSSSLCIIWTNDSQHKYWSNNVPCGTVVGAAFPAVSSLSLM